MDQRTFQKFQEIVFEHSGIQLNDSKKAMVNSRISKRMRVLGIGEQKDYLSYLTNDSSGDEIVKFLDVISTNVTSFFRESEHFKFIRELITAYVSNNCRKIRIWSAGSSTGEEPYSIAMTALDAARSFTCDIKILATDISTQALSKARAGQYESSAMKNVPPQYKENYFSCYTSEGKKYYRVKDVLRDMVVFRRLNLSRPPFPMKGLLDFIFCRNVMIYFDNTIKAHLVSEMQRLLKPGGYLFTGHAESLTSIESDFCCLRPSIYYFNNDAVM